MPRRSVEALSVNPVAVIPSKRPEPPEELTREQAIEWIKIVKSMPQDWFTLEMHPLLIALCVGICTLRKVSKEVDTIENIGSAQFRMMSKLQAQYATLVGRISTKLRLTPLSRHNLNEARKATKEAVRARQYTAPWDSLNAPTQ